MAGALGLLAGALAAAVIAWISLSQRFYGQPFGDWGAVGYWLLAIALDVAAYVVVAGGYAAIGGTPKQDSATVVGSIIAGVTVPLAIRSPIRTATLRGVTRSVGVTYVYDYLRAVVEDPLDSKLADLRRGRNSRLAQKLAEQGWTDDGLLAELADHLNYRRRLSNAEREKILTKATKAAKNLESPDDIRGIVIIVQENRCGGFLKLKGAQPR